jgi:hypothetical protein
MLAAITDLYHRLFYMPYIHIVIADFAEFLYKFIFYPYFFVYLDGFFDYYGKHGLSTGHGLTFFIRAMPGTDIKEFYYIKRDYMSSQKR